MKKTITILYLFFVGNHLFGQVQKGTLLFEGSFKYDTKSNPVKLLAEESYSQFGLSPSISYFVTDHVYVGAGFAYERKNSDAYVKLIFDNIQPEKYITVPTNTIKQSNETFIYAGFWKEISPKFYWSSLLSAGLGFGKITKTTSNPVVSTFYTSNYVAIRLKPSLNYLISNSLGLKLTFGGLSFQNTKLSEGNTKSDFNLNINPDNWEFGLFYALNRK